MVPQYLVEHRLGAEPAGETAGHLAVRQRSGLIVDEDRFAGGLDIREGDAALVILFALG